MVGCVSQFRAQDAPGHGASLRPMPRGPIRVEGVASREARIARRRKRNSDDDDDDGRTGCDYESTTVIFEFSAQEAASTCQQLYNSERMYLHDFCFMQFALSPSLTTCLLLALLAGRRRLGSRACFLFPREVGSGSRRFRSWNSLFVRAASVCPLSFSARSSPLLLGDDVSRNAYVVAS